MQRVIARTVLVAAPALLVLGSAGAVGAEPDPPHPPPVPPDVTAQATFPQCPNIGSNVGCGLLIVINADGTVTVLDSGQGPYDGDEDTLIGVQNNSSITITQLTLVGNTALPDAPFDFDGDGLCDDSLAPPGCPFGATGYEGPANGFSNISADKYTGDVLFLFGGIPPGGSAYFSLEAAISASDLTIAPFVIPVVEAAPDFAG